MEKQKEEQKQRTFFGNFRKVFKHKQGLIGIILVGFILFLAIFSPFFSPHNPLTRNMVRMLEPPSRDHFFGTDVMGRDQFSQILFGARVTMGSSMTSVIISLAIGLFLGIIAGFFGGYLDLIITTIMDFLLSFPTLIMALVIVSILGANLTNAVIAVGLQGVPIFTRFIRGEVLVQKNIEYIEGARALGAKNIRIIFKHLIPNISSQIIVLVSLEIPRVILMLAGLGFIGLGAQPPVLEWGRLLVSSRDFIHLAPWLLYFPGLAIMISVLGFNLLGNALRDIYDPSLRE